MVFSFITKVSTDKCQVAFIHGCRMPEILPSGDVEADLALYLEDELLSLVNPPVASAGDQPLIVYTAAGAREPTRTQCAFALRVALALPEVFRASPCSYRLYVLHPGFWLRKALYLNLTAALGKDAWGKLLYVDTLEDFEQRARIPLVAIVEALPAQVLDYDHIMRAWVGKSTSTIMKDASTAGLDPSKPLMQVDKVYITGEVPGSDSQESRSVV